MESKLKMASESYRIPRGPEHLSCVTWCKGTLYVIMTCIIMLILVNRTKVNNVRDHKSRVSFDRDHHALQVIPDRCPATVYGTNNLNKRIAIWNVRTMYQSGKMDNIIMEMKRMKISILGVCEVRWKQSGILTYEGTTFIYLGGIEHKLGVGMLFDENTAESLCRF